MVHFESYKEQTDASESGILLSVYFLPLNDKNPKFYDLSAPNCETILLDIPRMIVLISDCEMGNLSTNNWNH